MQWSHEISFDKQDIKNHVPKESGVYKVLQSEEYSRYRGNTRVLEIGWSGKSLCKEILNHFQRHTVANRLDRIRKQPGLSVCIVFAAMAPEPARTMEADLLRSFEQEHWELPVLNSQRGYGRDEDAHFRQ